MPNTPSDPRPGDRIAKLLARAGIASRREIERMIEDGRVAVDGVAIATPATVLTSLAGVTVDGNPVEAPAPARLFLYHKPTGLLVTERDPRGRATIYDRLPTDLPRVVPVGRLDLNTEGLLLLTTDGGFKRQLELPATGVERSYRARAYGMVTQAQLESLADGIEIEGVRYGSIDANIERRTGANVWVELTLTEGKNREVRRVLEHLGLQVSRLIRTRYGPFVLGDLPPGDVGEVRAQDIHNFRRTLKGGAPDEPVAATPRAGFRTVASTDRSARAAGRTAARASQASDDGAARSADRARTSGARRPADRNAARPERADGADARRARTGDGTARTTAAQRSDERSPRRPDRNGETTSRTTQARGRDAGTPEPRAARTPRREGGAPAPARAGFRSVATTDRAARSRGHTARSDEDAPRNDAKASRGRASPSTGGRSDRQPRERTAGNAPRGAARPARDSDRPARPAGARPSRATTAPTRTEGDRTDAPRGAARPARSGDRPTGARPSRGTTAPTRTDDGAGSGGKASGKRPARPPRVRR